MTKTIRSIIAAVTGSLVCGLSAFALGALPVAFADENEEAAAAVWEQEPSIVQWAAGKFDPTVNVINMKPAGEYEISYVGIVTDDEDHTAITVSLEGAGGSITPVNLGSIPVQVVIDEDDEDNYFYQIVDNNNDNYVAAINALSVGSYGLHVTSTTIGIDEYVSFNILKENGWVTIPSINTWSYGSFDVTQNIILAEAAHVPQNDRIHFSICDAFGNQPIEDINVILSSDPTYPNHYQFVGEYIERANALAADEYILHAWVNADDEYGYFETDIPFRVFQGYNSWVKTPSVVLWEYGSFDRETNFIISEVKYAVELGESERNDAITYTITDAEDNPITDLEDFSVVSSGMVGEKQAEALAKLEAGEYNLTATVKGSSNYYDMAPVTTKFNVLKATNSWTVIPFVEQWKVDEFFSDRNTPVATPKCGEAVIVVTDAETGEEVYYDSANGINRLNEMRPDSYLMTAIVEASDNYTGLSHTILFRVFSADEIVSGGGLPWWAVLLIVVGSLGVVAGVIAILHVKGVLSLFTGKMIASMRAKADIDATISAVRAGKITAYAQRTMMMLEAEAREEQAALESGEGNNADTPELEAAQTKEEKKAAKEAEALENKADALETKAKKLKSKSGNKSAEKKAEELEAQAEAARDIAGARKQKAKSTAKKPKTAQPKAETPVAEDGMIIDEKATIPPPEEAEQASAANSETNE
ncbi:MAG: hypothetical protein HDT28_00185 [Clostridiales bacterium]|nr:hypothetical protein [Clostridiales bacterium]